MPTGSLRKGKIMKIYKTKNYDAMSRTAANIISAQVIMKPNCVLGLATGSSPIGTYKQLVDWYNKGDINFAQVTTVNLDEYRGLTRDNDQSYYYFMHKNLFDHVNIKASYLPDGTREDAEEECHHYEEIIRSLGGVDLQLLGLGHNKRFFASIDDVPRQAYTMGIGTIMRARKILIIVSGEDKADIVRDAFFGPITPTVPASILQLHPDVTLVADEAALSRLPQ